ncbi:MAG: DNA mismatch repair endonuclease MutL [Angelakisella sp.]
MSRINVLDKKTAELIAAGEVIERPSSVIKELVENSIDAGATALTIEIKNGGVRLMRITDNGCGIDPEDIPKAFLRHATSKVQNEDDLYRIATLGFRGEALASVCAVSRVELVSRVADRQLGSRYTVEGGEGGAVTEIGAPLGTTIYVRDLFYNIPARMKFLKKDTTEGNAIATLLDRLALSHPEVAFRFLREGQQKLQTPGDGKLISAIYAVYGREFGAGLVPVSQQHGQIEVRGYIVKPEHAKATRSMEHFFINERYVRSVTVMAALEEAYRHSLMTGKFPGCVLHLRLPCQLVDVNVHPAKLEVKLSEEREVFDAVYSACRAALEGMPQAVAAADTAGQSVKTKLSYLDIVNRPTAGEQQHMTAEQYRTVATTSTATATAPRKPALSGSFSDNSAVQRYMEQLRRKNDEPQEPIAEQPEKLAAWGSSTVTAQASCATTQRPVEKATASPQPPIPEPASIPEPQMALPMLLVGEAFKTYLIAQQGDKLLLVDKHAAHERILFNRLKAQYGDGCVGRQLMLESIRLSLPKELSGTLLDNLPELSRLGFLAEDFGNDSILVREVPALLPLEQVEDTLLELAEKLTKGQHHPELDTNNELLHSIACKAAVKGGYFTGEAEQKKLLTLLQNDSTLRSCPHGRPIMVELTRRELEKMFGRIG